MDLPAMLSIQKSLRHYKLVPVVSLPSVDAALTLAELLVQCNLPVIEVTFRTPSALQAIAAINQRYPEMLVLAGTVLQETQAVHAHEAGAVGIVSPGFAPGLAAICKQRRLPFFPGVCTPSEVQMAREEGLKILKFFPAEPAGGTKMINLFANVYQDVTFMPTGGISPANLAGYLSCKNILCCGGTWLCPEELMIDGKWKKIERLISEALEIIKNIN
jgi:2-dehydro-3-deoxyphosphogluconate aldolase/(4S)-4-hydroxy-2-oxoglutarate aldolase